MRVNDATILGFDRYICSVTFIKEAIPRIFRRGRNAATSSYSRWWSVFHCPLRITAWWPRQRRWRRRNFLADKVRSLANTFHLHHFFYPAICKSTRETVKNRFLFTTFGIWEICRIHKHLKKDHSRKIYSLKWFLKKKCTFLFYCQA